MTTQLATDYQFTAKITGKGETPSGTPFLQFDWLLPGSKYPFQLLLGREPEVYAAWDVGRIAWVSIIQTGLKTGKDGRYSTDYFYNLSGIGDGDSADIAEQPVAPQPQGTPQRSQGSVSGAFPQVEGVVRGHVENIAVQLFLGLAGDITDITDDHLIYIRQLRDRVYHQLTSQPITPIGFCYEHSTARTQTKQGTWVHREGQDWCTPDGLVIGDEPKEQPAAVLAPPKPTRPEPAPAPEPPPDDPAEENPADQNELPF